LDFVPNVFAELRGVTIELIRRAGAVREREVSIGTLQATLNRGLACGGLRLAGLVGGFCGY
jgi:hypothetical protein